MRITHLRRLWRQDTSGGRRLFSPIELDGAELRGVPVRREWRNIDILIACDDPAFVIAAENKVDSGEHGDQLERYREMLEKADEFRGRPKHSQHSVPAQSSVRPDRRTDHLAIAGGGG